MYVLLLLSAALLTSVWPQAARSRPFGPGRCGPINASYVRGAHETGGQPFPLAPAELASIGQVMAETTSSDSVLIVWGHGSVAESAPAHEVPIDESLTRALFAITFDGTGGDAALVGPDGKPVGAGAGVQDTRLNCGRFVTVEGPLAGLWRVTARPSERFWLTVHGRSDIDLLSVEFVERGGRPGHEGLFRIPGQPIAGPPAMLRVRTAEPAQMRDPRFLLLSLDGRPLRDIQLARVDENEFTGPVDLPDVPFRVAARESAGAAPYQRVHAGLFHAELVEVRPDATDSIPPGQESPVVFTVRNHGPAARFAIQAVFGGQVVRRVVPQTVDIPSGAEQAVTVWVQPSSSDARATLTVVATSDGAPRPTSNSAVRVLRVSPD